MKSTRRKNILRGIRQSLNRYLSILFIVALGAGFLAGLSATSPDMFENADHYMDEYRWYDIDVKATQGLTDADLEALRALEGVETAQGARVMDMVLVNDRETELTTRVFAMLDENGQTELNRLNLKEGRMPARPDECVAQAPAGRYTLDAPAVGDVLTLSEDDTRYDELVTRVAATRLRVVGIVESPMCISVEREPSTAGSGSVALQAFVQKDFLKLDFDTDIFLTVRGAAELDTFSDAYDECIENVTSALEALGETRAPLRTQELREAGEAELTSANELVNALEEVAKVRQKLVLDAAARARQNAAVAEALNDASVAEALAQTSQAVSAYVQSAIASRGAETARLDDLKEQTAAAAQTLDALKTGSWLVRTRHDSVGYANYRDNVEKVSALCRVFPVFFFSVALLVALTTMTRLVEERRTQIGTLKALGFSDGQILGEYLLYSLSSSLIGCALGFVVGFRLFPSVINSAYGMMYTLPPMETPFRPDLALLVAPVTVGGILLATVWACYGSFRSRPAQLMRPKAPSPGKRILLERIPFVWKRLSFTGKVTCRNLFRYKKRLFMTIIGMAGCSALMLTGFGLRDSINDIVYKQFGEIFRYQLSIVTDDENAVETDEALRAFLRDSSVTAYIPYHTENGRAQGAAGGESVAIAAVADPSAFGEYIALRERKTGKALTLTDDAVILTEKLCEKLGVGAGDTVTLESAGGVRARMTVGGVTENYIAYYAYLTQAGYERAFGEAPAYTTLLCLTAAGADMDALVSDAIRCPHVLYASAASTLMKTFDDSVKSIDAIVWVLILAAGMLSMVVNYNLTNVNVCERRKELATIRVLGFHEREVERYIFRETNALSLIGSLIGLVVGIWLHAFVVRTVEVNFVMFGREIKPLSYAYALAISVLFTFLVNRVMSRTIRRVDMVESMKANE